MVNISTSGATKNRDFTTSEMYNFGEIFFDLYNDVMNSLNNLKSITDQVMFDEELNKLKKKMKKLIKEYFDGSLNDLVITRDHGHKSKDFKLQLNEITNVFNL